MIALFTSVFIFYFAYYLVTYILLLTQFSYETFATHGNTSDFLHSVKNIDILSVVRILIGILSLLYQMTNIIETHGGKYTGGAASGRCSCLTIMRCKPIIRNYEDLIVS